MNVFRNPELRGIAGLLIVILLLGVVLSGATGKLEQWFNITWFSGPQALDKIAFLSETSGGAELCVMNADGSDRKNFTVNARASSEPTINAMGTRIAYVGTLEGMTQVFSVRTNGTSLQQLTSATGPKSRPQYSPDGRKLAFIAGGKVYVAQANGDDPDPVFPTEAQTHAAMTNPLSKETPVYTDYAWGPGGSMIGVTRDPSGSDVVVYLAKPDAQEMGLPAHALANQVTSGLPDSAALAVPADQPALVGGIAWAAEKAVFTFSVYGGKNSFVFVIDASGSKPQLVGFRPFAQTQLGSVRLSPDGTKLVAAARFLHKGVPAGLLAVDLQDKSVRFLARGIFENLVYSPGGDRILATRLYEKTDKKDVVSVDLTSGKVSQLTSDGSSFNAIWSPSRG